jgi:hypothetical protein
VLAVLEQLSGSAARILIRAVHGQSLMLGKAEQKLRSVVYGRRMVSPKPTWSAASSRNSSYYFFATHLAYCGETRESLRFLKLAIDENYCSYLAMDLDPLFGKIRTSPEFRMVRAAGIACHEDFVANHERGRRAAVSQP